MTTFETTTCVRPSSIPAAVLGVLLAGVLILLTGLPVWAGEAPIRVAVFDFELIDTSLDGAILGPDKAETARLTKLGGRLRTAFSEAHGYRLVDIAPVEAEAKSRNLDGCNACAVDLAKRIGADWAVTGTVQKVSNLILNINVYVRRVETGAMIQAMSADIRGNTDLSWQRGLDWLIAHRLKLQATNASPKQR